VTHHRNDWRPDQIAKDAEDRISGRASTHWTIACFFEDRVCKGKLVQGGKLTPCECPCHRPTRESASKDGE
jgi:hypothetical protein